MFEYEQTLIQEKLQNISAKISFTFDGWTSKNQKSFLGVTAHWINENWDLKQVVLDFYHLEGSHSGENISKTLIKILKKYGILTKVN